jgi:hypothetical protein
MKFEKASLDDLADTRIYYGYLRTRLNEEGQKVGYLHISEEAMQQVKEKPSVVIVDNSIYRKMKSELGVIFEIKNFDPTLRKDIGMRLNAAIDKRVQHGEKDEYIKKLAKSIGVGKRSFQSILSGVHPLSGEAIVSLEKEYGIHRDEILNDPEAATEFPSVLRRMNSRMSDDDTEDDIEQVLDELMSVIDRTSKEDMLEVCDKIRACIAGHKK